MFIFCNEHVTDGILPNLGFEFGVLLFLSNCWSYLFRFIEKLKYMK